MAHRPSEEFEATTVVQWTRSDNYHNSFLLPADEALEFTLKNSEAKGLPPIAVSAAQGEFLRLQALVMGAKRALEVGTLGGYSALCLAKGMPEDGKVLTLELDPERAQVAEENIAHAGLSSVVQVQVGSAPDTLNSLPREEPFDIAFIDADKTAFPLYFQLIKPLLRKGGVMIFDNVVQNSLVSDPEWKTIRVEGIRKLLQLIKEDPDFRATTIGTAGEKGYDGFLYAVKTA
ncbi:O-methyltransferase-domain-containing protein [Flagelloscypha sp. PMI_526]|nr:O-methyltransferase-domain-containing protein [Flagelloscypha sp. PMI_526]